MVSIFGLSSISLYYNGKAWKILVKTINLNISPNMVQKIWITRWIIFCFRYLSFFQVSHKKHEKATDNLPNRIYVNKIEDIIIFKNKTGYYLEFFSFLNSEITFKHWQ